MDSFTPLENKIFSLVTDDPVYFREYKQDDTTDRMDSYVDISNVTLPAVDDWRELDGIVRTIEPYWGDESEFHLKRWVSESRDIRLFFLIILDNETQDIDGFVITASVESAIYNAQLIFAHGACETPEKSVCYSDGSYSWRLPDPNQPPEYYWKALPKLIEAIPFYGIGAPEIDIESLWPF